MLLLMVFMICCGFTEMVPPPPAKKAILIELTSGGGGGGGVQASQHKTQPASSSVPVATQNAEEAPVISGTHKPKTTAEKTPVVEEPKPDVNALP